MSFPFTVPLSAKEIITPTSTQRCPLGTRGASADGRIYRYAKAGATALVKGYLVQAEAGDTSWANTTASYISTAFLTEIGTTYIPAGMTYTHLSATMDTDLYVAKDHFKEGWIWVSGTSTSAGQMVKVKTHNQASSGSTGLTSTGGQLMVYFENGYAFSENMDTAAEISIIKNEYDDLIVVPAAAATCIVLGAPNCDVTAAYYFWLQTWGVCPLKTETTDAIFTGKGVWNSTQVAGAVQGITASTDLTGTDVLAGRRIGEIVSSSEGALQEVSTNILVHLTLAP